MYPTVVFSKGSTDYFSLFGEAANNVIIEQLSFYYYLNLKNILEGFL